MELIKNSERNGKQVVSARELHSFLESKKQCRVLIMTTIKYKTMKTKQLTRLAIRLAFDKKVTEKEFKAIRKEIKKRIAQ